MTALVASFVPFFILSHFKRWNPAEEGARQARLSFNNLANLSFFFYSSLHFFVFVLTTVAPMWYFFFSFLFWVASSRRCALGHHITPFSCQQRRKGSLCQHIVSVVKTKYSVTVFPLSSAATWIHDDVDDTCWLSFIYQLGSVNRKQRDIFENKRFFYLALKCVILRGVFFYAWWKVSDSVVLYMPLRQGQKCSLFLFAFILDWHYSLKRQGQPSLSSWLELIYPHNTLCSNYCWGIRISTVWRHRGEPVQLTQPHPGNPQ